MHEIEAIRRSMNRLHVQYISVRDNIRQAEEAIKRLTPLLAELDAETEQLSRIHNELLFNDQIKNG